MPSGEWRSLFKRGNRATSAAFLTLVEIVTVFIFAQTSYPLLYWMLPPLALLADLINWELLGASPLSASRMRVDTFHFDILYIQVNTISTSQPAERTSVARRSERSLSWLATGASCVVE
jgi:hypothetical protein